MLGHGFPCVFQGGVQRGANLSDGNGPVKLPAIDKKGRRSVNAKSVRFLHRGANRIFILRFDAGLQLHRVEAMFLPLQQGDFIDGVEARDRSLFRIYLALVCVDVVSEIPIGIAALRCQAICIDGSVERPGMDLGQRVMLED